MAVNLEYAGRQYPPSEPYVVSREKLRDFAEAVAATNPVHFDPAAARAQGYPDIVATPTFAVVVAQKTEHQYIADPEAGVDFSRVVHAEERFSYTRPIVAGDELISVLHVDSLTERGGLAMVSTRVEISDADGAPVATVHSTLAVRGADK